MATNQPATRILDKGDFNSPQLELSSSGGDNWTRIRLDHLVSGGGSGPFWDIAVSPDSQVLNIFASSNTRNVVSIRPNAVRVEGDLSVAGAKGFVQPHPTNSTQEIVYVSLEGGEAGTYARGTGLLSDGRAVIDLPEHFGLVTSDRNLTVHLTPRGQWLQLYVESLGTDRCVVREAQGRSGTFDYIVHGVRRGFEDHEPVRTNLRALAV